MAEEKYTPLKDPYHPLKHLAALRRGFSDEIPTEIIHSNSPNNLFKIRNTWWVNARADLENASNQNLVSDKKLKRAIRQFNRESGKLIFGDDTPASRRTAEEIKWANEFTDRVLEQTGYANVLLDLSLLDPKTK